MGKDKNAPRTKGNQKPSSSSRSAELLGGLGESSGFLGFGMAGGFLPATQSGLKNDNSISDNFRLAMRKMAKKDAITKLKALQEFDELILSEDISSIKTALPFWPRLFCKLSLDIDNKVRESCQVCHGHLAVAVSKLLGPHLRALAPHWLLAMSDTSSSVAAAARAAFSNTFCEEKQPGVIFHASKEILDLLSENLFKHTPDTLSDPNSCSTSERQEKYERVVCSSLQCLALIYRLTHLHLDFPDMLHPALSALLQQQQFWQLSNHSSAKVRASFYSSACVVLQCAGCDVGAAREAIRRGLTQQEPIVLAHSATALLHLVHHNPSCWSEVPGTKSLSGAVLRVFADQCRGAATEVAPLLLPLLAHLPHTALANPADYYNAMLQACADGVLDCEKVANKQEVTALQLALFESIKYLSKQDIFTLNFWQQIIQNTLGPVLRLSFEGSRHLDSCAVFEQVVSLSHCWAQRRAAHASKHDEVSTNTLPASEDVGAQVSSDNIEGGNSGAVETGSEASVNMDERVDSCKLLTILWSECFKQCNLVLHKCEELSSLERVHTFLSTVKSPKAYSQSKKSGVKFLSTAGQSTPKKALKGSNDGTSSQSSPSPDELLALQFSECVSYVEQMVTECYQLYSEIDGYIKLQEKQQQYMKVLCTLLNVFSSLKVFRALVSREGLPDDQKCVVFMQQVMIPQLAKHDYNLLCMVVESWLQHLLTLDHHHQSTLLTLSLSSCSVEGLRAVLESVTRLRGADLSSSALQTWLCSAVLGARLVSTLQEALALTAVLACEDSEQQEGCVVTAIQQREHLLALLQLVLSAQHVNTVSSEAEFLLSSNFLSQLLMVLHTSMPTTLSSTHYDDDGSKACISTTELLLQLSKAVFCVATCWRLQHSTQLLHALFLLSTPSDLLLTAENTGNSDSNEELIDDGEKYNGVLTNSVLPPALTRLARETFLEAFKSFVNHLSTDEEEEIVEQYQGCLKLILSHVKSTVDDNSCSYAAAQYLSQLITECLLLISAAAPLDEEWDVPLDQLSVRDALDVMIPSEGRWAELEDSMSTEYISPTRMLSPYALTPRNATLGKEDFNRWAVFVCGLLAGLSSDDTQTTEPIQQQQHQYEDPVELLLLHLNATERPIKLQVDQNHQQSEQQLSLGPYCRLVCLCVHACCHLSTELLLHTSLARRPSALQPFSDHLTANTRALVSRLNLGNLQLVAQVTRDRASHSELWTPTLQLLLSDWVKPSELNVTKLFDGVDTNASNATAVKQILIGYLSPAEVHRVLSSSVSELSALTNDPLLGISPLAVATAALRNLKPDATADQVHVIMDVLLVWWQEQDSLFLFAADRDSGSRSSGEEMLCVVSVVRAVSAVVTGHSHHLTATHWERLLCATTAWVQSLQHPTMEALSGAVLGTLVCAVGRSVASLELLITRLLTAPDHERKKYPDTLVQEWQEFYSTFLHKALLPLFFQVSGSYGVRCDVSLYCVCRALSEYCVTVPLAELTNAALPFPDIQDNTTHALPAQLQSVLASCTERLLCSHASVAGASYRMLLTLLPTLVKHCCSEPPAAASSDTEQHTAAKLPSTIIKVIEECGEVVTVALRDRGILEGECVVLPHTDCHTYTLGYCLAWHLLLRALHLCPHDNTRNILSLPLRSEKFVPRLLNVLAKLLPPVLQFPASPLLTPDQQRTDMVKLPLIVTPSGSSSSSILWWLASQLYLEIARTFPHWFRNWYFKQQKKAADAINEYTTEHFSPVLIAEQINTVKSYKDDLDLVKMKVRSQREVVTSYSIDESEVTLTLELPANLPVAPAVMSQSQHNALSAKTVESWKRGVLSGLAYSNFPLLYTLKAWIHNLDAKYQGVEPCYICYCVLHPKELSMPTKQCRTCKNKYHSTCIYHWFSSSNKSTCPVCRGIW